LQYSGINFYFSCVQGTRDIVDKKNITLLIVWFALQRTKWSTWRCL